MCSARPRITHPTPTITAKVPMCWMSVRTKLYRGSMKQKSRARMLSTDASRVAGRPSRVAAMVMQSM
jgi:hypothetical protein